MWIGHFEIVDRGGRRGEIEHVVDLALHMKKVGDVVVEEAEAGVAEQVADVVGGAGDHVVDAGDPGAGVDQPGADVRAEEAGTTEDNGMFAIEFGERAQAGSTDRVKGHGFQCTGNPRSSCKYPTLRRLGRESRFSHRWPRRLSGDASGF